MLENKGVYMLKKLNLDIFRFIAALMIVAIHIYPLAVFNQNVDYFFTRVIFRIGVPLFLMITGFFVLPKALKDKNKLKDYTFKILKIYILSILIFLPINIYSGTFKNLDIINVLKDIFINGTMYHLWYFPALILGIWITYFLLKYVSTSLIAGLGSDIEPKFFCHSFIKSIFAFRLVKSLKAFNKSSLL